MLQQTRARAVLPYYERFLARFPTVEDLARAPEPDVLACWSGLGYYFRARNLRKAAQRIVRDGAFPRDYDSIRALPGVGDYTAAAIASIAFDLPYAVLDGNVMRVIARLQNDSSDITSSRTRKRFRRVAQELLDPLQPGRFNQALMELGATVCLPREPLCLLCPAAAVCEARLRGTVAELPVKLRRIAPRKIEAALVVCESGGRVLLRQREAGSRRMAGFWELPAREQLPGVRLRRILGSFRHTITHHQFAFTVWSGKPPKIPAAFQWFAPADLITLPLATTARKALRLAGFVQKL